MHVESSKLKVCVIGAGNGGLAAAADLTIRGNDVILFELPEFEESIKSIKEKGGINLKVLNSSNLKGGFARLYKITTDISEALNEAEIVLVVTPSFAHRRVAKVCAKYLSKEQIIVLAPGNFGGSIDFYHTVKESGGDENIIVSEFESMMYACRKINAHTVYVRGYKHHLGFATFPSIQTSTAFYKVREIYPHIELRNNVLETGLSNSNPISHVPIMLFNLSLIDNKAEPLMYHEAFTKSIEVIIEKLDQERTALNNIINGLSLQPIKCSLKKWYQHQGAKGSTLLEILGRNPIYYVSRLPNTLNHRYFDEDVAYGLVPIMEMINKVGGKAETMKQIIDLSCIITGNDYYHSARDLRALQLSEMSASEIMKYVTYRSYQKESY